MAKIDAVFSNGLGDAVMVLPALFALRKGLGTSLRIWTDSRLLNELFFDTLGPLGQLDVRIDSDGHRKVVASPQVVREDFAPCILWMNSWIDQEFLATVASANRSTISPYSGATCRIPWCSTQHDFQKYFEFARLLGFADQLEEHFGWPSTTPPTNLWRRSLADLPFVVLHFETATDKMLRPDDEAALIAEVANRFPRVLFVSIGRELLRRTSVLRSENVLEISGLSLSACIGLIGSAHAVVGYDSSFLHAADLMGVPAIGLFVSTPVAEFGLFRAQGRTLDLDKLKTDIGEAVCDELSSLLQLKKTWRSWKDERGQIYWSRLRCA